MKTFTIGALTLAALLAATACRTEDTASSEAQVEGRAEVLDSSEPRPRAESPSGVRVFDLVVDGKEITCVSFKELSGVSGMSCDWEGALDDRED